MNNLITLLNEYAQDPNSYQNNFNLAKEYFKLGQTGSATTHYLRAAERANCDLDAYKSLLFIAVCFISQGNRKQTVVSTLKHCICLLPNRPEAYFLLSRELERTGDHVDAYTWASVALSVCDFSLQSIDGVDYPGKYGLIFEKAVSSWYWGRTNESRRLFIQLNTNYNKQMDPTHKKSVEYNLNMLGAGPNDYVYTDSRIGSFKFDFDNLSKIKNNYSQVYQDMFILAALNGKKNGTFLEVGGYTGFHKNNTALLELEFGWTGTSIEIDKTHADQYKKERPQTKMLNIDATTADYSQILSEISNNGIVDYLQLDIDPPHNTFEAMLNIPFDKFKFAVITYEHDHYLDMTQSYRNKSRAFLKSHGYELIVPNVSAFEDSVFEDWWVHPDLVDKDILQKLRCKYEEVVDIEKYMFSA